MAKYDMKLEPLCEVEAYLAAPVPVGPSSWGTRLILPVEGGAITGPGLQGKIQAFGADWGLIRPDNCLELDVRLLIETHDGALIHTYYNGVIDMTDDQVEEFLGGAIPKDLDIYVTPRFETSYDTYRWLTRIQAVGIGGVEVVDGRILVSYSWYKLSAPKK